MQYRRGVTENVLNCSVVLRWLKATFTNTQGQHSCVCIDHTLYLHNTVTVFHEHKHTKLKIQLIFSLQQMPVDVCFFVYCAVRHPETHTMDIQMSLRASLIFDTAALTYLSFREAAGGLLDTDWIQMWDRKCVCLWDTAFMWHSNSQEKADKHTLKQSVGTKHYSDQIDLNDFLYKPQSINICEIVLCFPRFQLLATRRIWQGEKVGGERRRKKERNCCMFSYCSFPVGYH